MTTKPTKLTEIEFRLEKSADGPVVNTKSVVANMATLSDVLRAWSDVIESIVAGGKPPAPGEHKVVVRRVESASPHRMYAVAPSTHLNAISLVTRTSEDGRPHGVPTASVPYVRTLFSVLRKAGSSLHIMGNDRAKIRETVLTPPAEEPVPPVMEGETTYTGVLVEAGGKKPNIHIDIGNRGKPIVVDTDKKNARELGAHLYSTIAVDVQARWDAESADLIECRLLRWRPGPTKTFAEGISAMAKEHGHAWRDGSVADWMRKIRDDEDE